jgi:aquaporin Z
MKKYITEFIGTFFLMLAIVLVNNNGTAVGFAPLAIGITYAGLVYAGQHISGAYYNPAVTLAMFINKKINLNDMMGYVLAQVIASFFAAFTAMSVGHGIEVFNEPRPLSIEPLIGLVAEFLGTFLLVYVVKNVTLSTANSSQSFYGLAIGGIVAAMLYTFGPVSGGSFNPAVAVGLCSIKAFDWQYLWVYLIGSLGGAAVAAIIYTFLNDEKI